MESERAERAVARIDAALVRLQAAASHLPDRQTLEQLAQERARNDRLRQAVAEALGQIDALIDGARS